MPENAKGVLFKNDKKSGSQPDWTGNVELTVDLLEAFLKEAKGAANKTYKARLASWVKDGQRGKFLSISLSAPFNKGGQATGSTVSDDPF